MSSTTYSACLTPDPKLRRVVLGSGCGLAVAGLVLILQMPIAASLRTVAVLLWVGVSYRELLRFRRCYKIYSAIHVLAGGEVRLLNADQQWVLAERLNGSMLLASAAWLRLKTPDGHEFAELLRGNRRHDREWRRLHVIWRHIGAPE